MKIKKCIRCGIRLHPTDWLVLKEMLSLPICDSCSLIEEKQKLQQEENNK
ncbi:hypothetical protein [Fictibacillus phosphorivorans]